jgi:hypothetical protein
MMSICDISKASQLLVGYVTDPLALLLNNAIGSPVTRIFPWGNSRDGRTLSDDFVGFEKL